MASTKKPRATAPKRSESTADMSPPPKDRMEGYKAAGKLRGQAALITGGDSGIGRAVAVAFAKEGANVAIVYLQEDEDAKETERLIEAEGRQAVLIKGDIGSRVFSRDAVRETVRSFGRLDILVNNAGEQKPQESIADITEEQLERTFRTNVFGMFFMTKAALPQMTRGASIINTSSVTAYQGSEELLDYSATKGAIVAFTYSLAKSVAPQGIRVNAVAPGPVWTPLVASTFDKKKLRDFGKDTLMGRPGEPDDIAPSYVFLATEDSCYVTGQVIHPNGGRIVNG